MIWFFLALETNFCGSHHHYFYWMELAKKSTHYFSQTTFCNCISVFPIFQGTEFSNLFAGISQDWNCKWHEAFSAVQKWKLLDCHAVQIPVSISSYSLYSSAGLLLVMSPSRAGSSHSSSWRIFTSAQIKNQPKKSQNHVANS